MVLKPVHFQLEITPPTLPLMDREDVPTGVDFE
jgi:hypothetical protein